MRKIERIWKITWIAVPCEQKFLPLPVFSRKIKAGSLLAAYDPLSAVNFRHDSELYLLWSSDHANLVTSHADIWWSSIKRNVLNSQKHHTWLKQNIRARYQHLLVTQSTYFEINGYIRGWAQNRSTCFLILEAHFGTCKLPKVILVVSVLFSSVICIGLSWLFCFYELSY